MKKPFNDQEWNSYLSPEFEKPYMSALRHFLVTETKKGKVLFPPSSDVFNAFNSTSFKDVKVVILGQDPYHGKGQAHGLCFSVQTGVKPPPSLVNIFKELQTDVGIVPPGHGNLEAWARKGVLLLNTVLTVEEGLAGSHHKKGWETFTDKVIAVLNQQKESLVFILWGSPAQKKASQVDPDKHCILRSVHPSPLSVHRGFYGSRPFSKTNSYLRSKNIGPIDWSLD
ncbi:MAG TPA: uracil-DNA glycosylase [Bacteriovoracaceae bacterium]|nr:uracil-DNA glycosylase [Bacteriovoracaceae bacterium]